MPPPIVIGCVNDAPAPVLEIVSGAEVTTEVSVVGKASDAGLGLALAPGSAAAEGAVVDETTDVSSVGKRGGALAPATGELSAPAIGTGSGFVGRPDSPVRFDFSNAAC